LASFEISRKALLFPFLLVEVDVLAFDVEANCFDLLRVVLAIVAIYYYIILIL
jgi:hypothetical protein